MSIKHRKLVVAVKEEYIDQIGLYKNDNIKKGDEIINIKMQEFVNDLIKRRNVTYTKEEINDAINGGILEAISHLEEEKTPQTLHSLSVKITTFGRALTIEEIKQALSNFACVQVDLLE